MVDSDVVTPEVVAFGDGWQITEFTDAESEEGLPNVRKMRLSFTSGNAINPSSVLSNLIKNLGVRDDEDAIRFQTTGNSATYTGRPAIEQMLRMYTEQAAQTGFEKNGREVFRLQIQSASGEDRIAAAFTQADEADQTPAVLIFEVYDVGVSSETVNPVDVLAEVGRHSYSY